MKSSSLALIDHTAVTALQNLPKTRKITRQVAGFDVEDVVPYTSDDITQGFKQDADALRASLSSAGITPLAVIPTVWWDRIVTRSKLVDFEPSGKGTVGVHLSEYATAIKRGWYKTISFFATWFTLAFAVSAILYHTAPINMYGVVLLPLIPTVLATAALANWWESAWAWIVSSVYTMTRGGNKRLLVEILRKSKDGYSARHVGVTLPRPPSNVMDILLKADRAQMRMRVAAVPEAVQLAQSPRQLIANEVRDQWSQEALERREAARVRALDPIIYVMKGSAVAVIAQFGDFPIEQRIVEEVVQSRPVA
jgi:hypothetical protein